MSHPKKGPKRKVGRTHVLYSRRLNQRKLAEITLMAEAIGELVRKPLWDEFSCSLYQPGSREIRDEWYQQVKAGKLDFSDLPAKAWRAAVLDTAGNITAYKTAQSVDLKSKVFAQFKDEEERKLIFTAMKRCDYTAHPWLKEQMQPRLEQGVNKCFNQINVESDQYSLQRCKRSGNTVIKIPSLSRGKRIAIPLTTKMEPQGNLRVIVRGDKAVEVHFALPARTHDPCGDKIRAVDKGYSVALTDEEGVEYGKGLGEYLTQHSDKVCAINKQRNKLWALGQKHLQKAEELEALKDVRAKKYRKKYDNIMNINLGRVKKQKRHRKHQSHVKCIMNTAVHKLVDECKVIYAEELKFQSKGKNWGRKTARILNNWQKGILDKRLQYIAESRGSRLVYVNAAYTSQIDSKTGYLEGKRKGKWFYHADGTRSSAEQNAAKNIRYRGEHDKAVTLYMPHNKVKELFLERGRSRSRYRMLWHPRPQAPRLELQQPIGCYQPSANYQ